MRLKFQEIYDKLKNQEIKELVEMLDITSEELLDRFLDRVEEQLAKINVEVEE